METKEKAKSLLLKTLSVVMVTVMLFSVMSAGFSVGAYYDYYDFDYWYSSSYGGYIIEGYDGYDSELIIPEEINGSDVVGIEDEAFYEDEFTYVSIPDTVTFIGDSAFADCYYLERVDMSANIESSGNSAFSYCERLTSIELPSTLKSVGNWAFDGCDSLTTLVLPEGLTTIGWGAFYGVPAFRNLVLPNTVKTIGEYAFARCNNLYSVTIPDSTTMVYPTSFYGCKILNAINVSANNKYYKSVGGCLFSKDGTRLYTYPIAKTGAYYTVPSTVKTIEVGAFDSARNLVGIVVPWGVTTIGDGAFCDALKLTTVTLPASLSNLGSYCFSGSYNITAVNVNASNKYYKSVNGVLYSKDGATLIYYPEGKKDTSFTMPDTVKSFSFYNKNVTSVKISKSVTALSYNIFADCSKLTTVTIPKSVKSISNAFGGTNLKTINYDGTKADWEKVAKNDSKLASVKVNFKTFKATSLKLNKTKLSLKKGASATLVSKTTPAEAAGNTTYKSSNSKIASVSTTGKVTAKSLGKTKITATNSGKKASCTVSVTSASTSVLRKKSKSLKSLVKNIKGYKKAKWSTSNSKIATVSKTGTVKAKKAGTCKIYCKIGKTKYTITVKVVNPLSMKVVYCDDTSIYNELGIRFTNNSSKKINYVTFNIKQYDNRGNRLRSPYDYFYLNETIPANSSQTWEYWVNDDTKKAKISIKKVWFTDGSTWTP